MTDQPDTASTDIGPPPTVGRIVHYLSHTNPEHGPAAAIITAVYDGSGPYAAADDQRRVDLFVMTPWSETRKVFAAQGTEPGQWSWPPRVG